MAGAFTVVGLFKGMSGQIGSLAGLVAGLASGYFLFSGIKCLVVSRGWVSGSAAQGGLSAALDVIVALVAFGLVRRIVAKFVSFLVPQPMNALAGALIGLFKGGVVIGLLAGAGLVQTGRFSEGFFAARSGFVRMLGSVADSYMQGARGE